MDLTKVESKATYEEIRTYVKDHLGLHVMNLYIAQVKREFGIIEWINYHVGGGNQKCHKLHQKKEAIIDVLKYFQMI